jgi:hypothetical protein
MWKLPRQVACRLAPNPLQSTKELGGELFCRPWLLWDWVVLNAAGARRTGWSYGLDRASPDRAGPAEWLAKAPSTFRLEMG